MNSGNKHILQRIYLLSLPIGLLCLGIVYKLIDIQLIQGPELREQAKRLTITNNKVTAERGSIYSTDGKLLATNITKYSAFFDTSVAPEDSIIKHINALSTDLNELFPKKTAAEWKNLIEKFRKNREHNKKVKENKINDSFKPIGFVIGENLSLSQAQKLRSMPIFKDGQNKGGLVLRQSQERKLPLGQKAQRTIGSIENKSGLEQAFNSYLEGKDGIRLEQRISSDLWKPLTDYYSREPENGKDVVSTIDSRLQDIAHAALLKQLEAFEAEHGCAVLMEVKTGAIRAMVNLGRNAKGTAYYERLNYALRKTPPGSTVKPLMLMRALEASAVDTGMQINTGNGILPIGKKPITDSNYKNGKGGYGTISLAKCIEVSSNTGIVKALFPVYKNRPEDLISVYYHLQLDKPTGIGIVGEDKPILPNPKASNWHQTDLARVIIGYQTELSPMQILMAYNAIANNGIMLRPQLVEKIQYLGAIEKSYEPEPVGSPICQASTLKILRQILEKTMERGTGSDFKHPSFSMAGKTGTANLTSHLEKQAGERDVYQASFVGYFPANSPQYSCIVVVYNPNANLGYYGSQVAGPVFKEIAGNAYRISPQKLPNKVFIEPLKSNKTNTRYLENTLQRNQMPNVRGLRLADAIHILENEGLRVKLEGFSGKVVSQWPQAGEPIPAAKTIILRAG